MSKTMLIDATRPEETRVAIADGSRLEDYDVAIASRKQIKGNVYLAKVVRVEPSLQAAFVDYGHERHGFLSFNEIHPDYFQIPVSDREAIVAEDSKLAKIESDQEAESDHDNLDPDEAGFEEEDGVDIPEEEEESPPPREARRKRGEDPRRAEVQRRAMLYRRYMIQEVINRNQLVLVQARKEERGSKGASFTTYISLPGRYMVLLPNTPHGRGMSRKIESRADRDRLKKIIADIDVPEGMSTILRTAGQGRTKSEIRRDLDYLVGLWSGIREGTLKSVGPTLIHQENDIVKRAVRDLYQSDVGEVIVAGNAAYQSAKDLVKTMTPSKARYVKQYQGEEPFFHHHRIERTLTSLHEPVVELPSGGSMVIAQTEALVTVDINSARAIRGRHIEETAYKTNLEASVEAARQFRLRDLGGLIVIDFISMEERPHHRAVEQKLRDALKGDRARTHVGRMSEFGLIEMSRQRLRQSDLDTRFENCSSCNGTGWTYLPEAHALMALRALEIEVLENSGRRIEIRVPGSCAGHLANRMRRTLLDLEEIHDVAIDVISSSKVPVSGYSIEIFPRSRADGPKEGARVETRRTMRTEPSGTRRRPITQDRFSPEDDEERNAQRGKQGRSRAVSARSESNNVSTRENVPESDEEERPSRTRRQGERGRARPMTARSEYGDDEERPTRTRRQGERGRTRPMTARSEYGDDEERPTRTRRQGERGRARPMTARSEYGDDEERPTRTRRQGERGRARPMTARSEYGDDEERPTRTRRQGERGRARPMATEPEYGDGEDNETERDNGERPTRTRRQGERGRTRPMATEPEYGDNGAERNDEERPSRTRRRGGRSRVHPMAVEPEDNLRGEEGPDHDEERPTRTRRRGGRGRGRSAAVRTSRPDSLPESDAADWDTGLGGDPTLHEPLPDFDSLPPENTRRAARDDRNDSKEAPRPKRSWWSSAFRGE